MMCKNKILVFGNFGYVTNQLDGQIVKTRSIYELLEQNCPDRVSFVDTQGFRSKPSSFTSFITRLFRIKQIVIIPAHNSLRFIFPFIFILSKLLGFEIIHVGVGGWLADYLSRHSIVRIMLRKVKVNLLENHIVCTELEKRYGFTNTTVIPNFRTEPIPECTDIQTDENIFRIVFMARIHIKKGLDVLTEVIKRLNNTHHKKRIIFDIYGPYDSQSDEHRKYFEENVLIGYDWVKYLGKLEPSEIVDVLKQYDIMLFPTRYYTEGFPGSILDSYRAGVPVIATEWQHSHQFVSQGESGFIVDFDNPVDEICEKVELLINDDKLLVSMKRNAYEESKHYTPDAAWSIMKPYVL